MVRSLTSLHIILLQEGVLTTSSSFGLDAWSGGETSLYQEGASRRNARGRVGRKIIFLLYTKVTNIA
jgi:hypothetical protein